MNDMNPMTCPKCGAPMRQYERNGVHVDQCEACRGIFLDMGELEAIIRATVPEPGAPQSHAQPQATPPQQTYVQPGYEQVGYVQPGYVQPGYGHPQQAYAPGWGSQYRRRGGIAGLFFSS